MHARPHLCKLMAPACMFVTCLIEAMTSTAILLENDRIGYVNLCTRLYIDDPCLPMSDGNCTTLCTLTALEADWLANRA